MDEPSFAGFTMIVTNALTNGLLQSIVPDDLRGRVMAAYTFVFVGAFQPDSLRPLVERWIGGLPTTGRQETWRDLGIGPPDGTIEKVAGENEVFYNNFNQLGATNFQLLSLMRSPFVLGTAAAALTVEPRVLETASGSSGSTV